MCLSPYFMDQGRPVLSSCGAFNIPEISRHVSQGWDETLCEDADEGCDGVRNPGQFEKYCLNRGYKCQKKEERDKRKKLGARAE